ncbi:MAG: putative rane protein [Nevskia sp.]|nr:putative rane protein [Nevskia sp.]
MKPLTLPRIRNAAPLILVAIAIFATAGFLPQHPFVDEYIHWPTARLFAQGFWPINPGISTWPTMNAVVGWSIALFGQRDHILAGRLVIVVFSLFAVTGFYRLAQQFDADSAQLRTAQFFLSPVVLPFCALIYTDLPALSCMLWAAVGALRRQPWLLIGAGLLACAFRQNDIVWFVALACLFGWLSLRAGDSIKPLHFTAVIAVVAAWLAVVYLQHGIAAGAYTQGDHPGNLKGMPNIWFALVVAALIYLPYFLWRLFRDGDLLKLWHYLALGVPVALTFHVNHRFNLIESNYFIRNYLLLRTTAGPGMAIFLMTVTTTAVLVFRTRLPKLAELRLPFLLFSALSLLPFWLIEQRYYLPIYALFWAMRAPEDKRVEHAQLLFGTVCSAWLIVRIAQGLTFL